jgi:hypothetical protein
LLDNKEASLSDIELEFLGAWIRKTGERRRQIKVKRWEEKFYICLTEML